MPWFLRSDAPHLGHRGALEHSRIPHIYRAELIVRIASKELPSSRASILSLISHFSEWSLVAIFAVSLFGKWMDWISIQETMSVPWLLSSLAQTGILALFLLGQREAFAILAALFAGSAVVWHWFSTGNCRCFGGLAILNSASPWLAVVMALLSGFAFWCQPRKEGERTDSTRAHG